MQNISRPSQFKTSPKLMIIGDAVPPKYLKGF